MAESVFLEVEENDNCEYMSMQLYETRADPAPIARVRLFEPGRPDGVYEVTGWSSEGGGTPCPAMYVPVSDSGQAVAHLISGGDWGIRMRPEGSPANWDLADEDQWGEPYLVLTDEDDILVET